VGVRVPLNDKVEHGIAYSVGGALAAAALAPSRRRSALVATAVLFCGLWGASDEFHQSFVPGRDSSVADLGADAVGGALGGAAFAVVASRSRSRPAESM
jgi:VanZ family protein